MNIMRDAQIPLDMMSDYPNLLKLAYGQGMDVDPSQMMAAHEGAETVFRGTVEKAKRNFGTDEDWVPASKGGFLSDQMAALLTKGAYGGGGWSNAFYAELANHMKQIGDSLNKDFTLTTPIPTGLVPYDLVAPARLLYPFYSPLRNRIPRTPGQGTSRRFKYITAIEGSRDDFFGSSLFIDELPGGNTMSQFNLPPAGTVEGDEANVPYAFMGVGDFTSLLAEMAGRGFQDVDALLNKILLQRAMVKEERTMLFTRKTSALARPTTQAAAGQTPTGSYQAISGMDTHLYVKVTACSGLGETDQNTAVTVTPSGGQDIRVTWAAVAGALFYRVYLSTGATDPGDTARFKAAEVTGLAVEIGGAIPTSGAVIPTSNTTRDTKGYDGIIPQIAAGGGYVKNLDGPFSVAGRELQDAFQGLWDTTRAKPQELIMSGGDRNRLSTQLLAAENGSGIARLTFTRDETGRIIGGQVVTSVWNQTTGDEVPLTVHPWMHDGTALFMSYGLPLPGTETPNVWENVMVQDYLGLTFPLVDIARRFAIIWYGALVCYAPLYNGIITGITPS